MTGDSFKVEIRETKCFTCNGSMWKSGFTKHGHYQKYQCKECKKYWVELSPERPRIMRGHIKGYDE